MDMYARVGILAALLSGCLSPAELGGPDPPPEPAKPEMSLACAQSWVDSTWTHPDGDYPGHEPEQIGCELRWAGLPVSGRVLVTATPRRVQWAATGEMLSALGGITAAGACPEAPGRLDEDAVVLAGPASAGARSVCVACETNSRGGLRLHAELLEEPYLDATVDLVCRVRDPNRFSMTLVADEAQRQGREVPLLLSVEDHEEGSLVNSERVLIRPPRSLPRDHGLWGADEDGIISTDVRRRSGARLAAPPVALSFLCPASPGAWVLAASFRDRRRNGMASAVASVTCD